LPFVFGALQRIRGTRARLAELGGLPGSLCLLEIKLAHTDDEVRQEMA
jgi:hypothetical protein